MSTDTPAVPPEIARAQQLVEQGDVAAAEDVCRRVIKTEPESAPAYHLLGELLMRRSAFDEAAEVLGKGLTLHANSKSYGLLGQAFMETGRYQFAASIFESQTYRWPDEPAPYFNLGMARAHCFDSARSRAAFERGMSLKPPTPGDFTLLGQAHVLLGQTAQAMEAFHQALAMKPATAFVALTLSELYEAQGKTAESAAFYRHAEAYMDRSSATMRTWIGQVDNRGMKDEAFKLAMEFYQRFPDDFFGPIMLGGLYAGWGKYDEAGEYYARAVELKPHAGPVKELHDNFRRSVDTYIPLVRRLAAIPPDPRRAIGDDVIVIRGGLDESLIDIVRHYRAAHPGIFIVLSTWRDTAPAVLAAVQAYVDDVVLNARPPTPGVHNINYQIVCAANGVTRAHELGAVRVLLTRTDIALLEPDVMGRMRRELAAYDDRAAREDHGLRGRLLVNDLYMMLTPNYHLADMFVYGHAEDIRKLWSLDSMTGACVRPEVTLCRDFMKRIGWKADNTVADYVKLLGELFIIRDAPWFGFFWQRKPQILSSRYLAQMPFITGDLWRTNCYRTKDGTPAA